MSTDAQKPIGNYRVLIADDEGQRRLADYLKAKGFDTRTSKSGEQVKAIMREWIPHFIVADLTLPDGNALELVQHIKNSELLKNENIRVLVTSSHNSLSNVKECLKRGASDYIVKPFEMEDMLSRLIFHIQKKKDFERERIKKSRDSGSDFYIDLVEMVLRESTSGKGVHEIMFNLTRMLALTLKAVRCSVIQCISDRKTGFVRASHDDKSVKEIKIDLNRYPEVMHVMNTEKSIVIENMDYDPALAEIKKEVKTINFNGLIVCPVRYRGHFYGVISCRMPKAQEGFSDHDIRFAQMVSHVMSLVVSTIPAADERSGQNGQSEELLKSS